MDVFGHDDHQPAGIGWVARRAAFSADRGAVAAVTVRPTFEIAW
jgi:hypothetical protein